MKRFTLLLVALAFGFGLKAQCPITEAVDFNTTDCHGNQVHLFDILDNGQNVLIDFFYTTCGPCQQATPKVAEAYTRLGCNMHDVFFIEISPSDGDAALQNWCNNYGIEYPTIGTSGGGNSICSQYGIPAYPTVILITPDRSIVIQDLWPISSAQTIIDQLAPYGIQEHDCDAAEATVEITDVTSTTTTVTATFTPNDECASYYYLLGTQEEMNQWAQLFGKSIEELVVDFGIRTTTTETYTWTEQTPSTEYTIFVVPFDADNNMATMVTSIISTESAGGSGNSVIQMSVEVLSSTEVITRTTPNGETAEYRYGLITKEYYDEIGDDGLVQIIEEDPYIFYEFSEWKWTELTENTTYYGYARGKNANGEWGTITMIEFSTLPDAIGENSASSLIIFPNPANDFVTLRGENINNVMVFNAIGQKIDEFVVNGKQMNIATSNYENGIYFVKVNGTETYRFVVTH